MRGVVMLLALAAAGGCTERSVEALSGVPGARPVAGTLAVRVEDDGGVALAPGARPTVTLVLELRPPPGLASGMSSTVAVQAAVDSFATATLVVPDPEATRADGLLRLTIVAATLAVPGADAVDLLGGNGGRITRVVGIGRHAPTTLVVELNSARWLTPVPAPLPTEAPYRFDGTTAFLDALRLALR